MSCPLPPDRPIAQGIAGPGLIAEVIVTKFGDHLPLYRLEDIFVRDGPQEFLKTFGGYQHADVYAGYDAVHLGFGNEIVEVACWAHARRKFFDA